MRRHPKVELTPQEAAALRAEVLAWMERRPEPRIVVTTGLDGKPRTRLMGAKNPGGFTVYLLAVTPSTRDEELARDPEIRILAYQHDADDALSDQPVRFVEITGTAEVVRDPARIRTFPGWDGQPDPYINAYDDRTLAEDRYGIIVHPRRVRVEGFRPGPRWPVYLDPGAPADPA